MKFFHIFRDNRSLKWDMGFKGQIDYEDKKDAAWDDKDDKDDRDDIKVSARVNPDDDDWMDVTFNKKKGTFAADAVPIADDAVPPTVASSPLPEEVAYSPRKRARNTGSDSASIDMNCQDDDDHVELCKLAGSGDNNVQADVV